MSKKSIRFNFLVRSLSALVFVIPSVFATVSSAGDAYAQEIEERSDAINALVGENTYTLHRDNDQLSGAGADFLRAKFEKNHFVLMGESHATADIAHMARAIFTNLAPLGFNISAIEVDPWVTPMLERMVRTPDNVELKTHFASDANLLSIPFYNWREEVQFLDTVIDLSSSNKPVLWGVDQIFIAAGELVLTELVSMAESEAEIVAANAALERAKSFPGFVGMAPVEEVRELRDAFASSVNPRAGELVNEILLSNQIYSPFTGRGERTGLVANTMRENYMKDNLRNHFENTIVETGEIPKVFFKFGGYHMMWGHSGTNVLSLGNFVKEFAQFNGLNAMNILVTCLSGEASVVQTGGTTECEPYLDLEGAVITKHIAPNGLTLVDLKSLRHSNLFSHLDENSKDIILAFDVAILIQDVKASNLFEGTIPSFN